MQDTYASGDARTPSAPVLCATSLGLEKCEKTGSASARGGGVIRKISLKAEVVTTAAIGELLIVEEGTKAS